jgi:hypothetical protein
VYFRSSILVVVRVLLTLSSLVLFPHAAQAANYRVEVLVFQNLDGAGAYGGQTDSGADYASALDLRGGGDGRFRASNALDLGGVRQRLDNSRQYRVLEHTAWTQPGLERNAARAVRIQSPGVMDGSIKVTLSRYLHVYTDFQFDGAGLAEPVHAKNHRRMRSRELHYIDHPLFGILVQITPV